MTIFDTVVLGLIVYGLLCAPAMALAKWVNGFTPCWEFSDNDLTFMWMAPGWMLWTIPMAAAKLLNREARA